MIGLGTIINTAAILAGGLLGGIFGRFLHDSAQDTLNKVCGVSTIFIAISGALPQMEAVENNAMLIIGCLALGALIGETLNIEGAFERFGAWLKEKTGNSKDGQFIDAFVTASLSVCIGAMAIVGAIQDGIAGDYTILLTKVDGKETKSPWLYFKDGGEGTSAESYFAGQIDMFESKWNYF